jgi:Carboxypeptidase regulatory-like domain
VNPSLKLPSFPDLTRTLSSPIFDGMASQLSAHPHSIASLRVLTLIPSLLVASCSTPSPTAPAIAPDFTGQVVELYTGAPIPRATVSVREGAIDRHARYVTDADGRFTLHDVNEPRLSLTAEAIDFESTVASGPPYAVQTIGLSPRLIERSGWTGMFTLSLGPVQRQTVPFVTHREGPVALWIDAGCSTADIAPPLHVEVLGSAGGVLGSINLNSETRQIQYLQLVLSPGNYTAGFEMVPISRSPDCRWSMSVRAPE